jgi:hypothetical protein
MNSTMPRLLVALAFGLIFAFALAAQTPSVGFSAASLACTPKERVGLTAIEIVYSRPGMKGRTTIGSIFPYGHI